MTTKKRVSAVSAYISNGASERTLHLEFANGRLLEIAPSQLSAEIQDAALLHGLKQKLVDAAAMSRNPVTGRSATIEDKFEAVAAVHTRLLAGMWNAVREGGGATGGMLFQALCRLYEGRKTPEQLKTYLDTLSEAQKTALRASGRIAPILEQLRAEAGRGIDSDALLDALDEDEEEDEGE